MNEETVTGHNHFSQHIEEWRKYGDAIMDVLRVCQVDHDVIDNITSHAPQLILLCA